MRHFRPKGGEYSYQVIILKQADWISFCIETGRHCSSASFVLLLLLTSRTPFSSFSYHRFIEWYNLTYGKIHPHKQTQAHPPVRMTECPLIRNETEQQRNWRKTIFFHFSKEEIQNQMRYHFVTHAHAKKRKRKSKIKMKNISSTFPALDIVENGYFMAK